MKNHSGFGLTEVLISLFLSSIIITSLIQLYFNVKRQYVVAEKKIAAQLEIQWVSDLLADSIRRAGFTPCLRIDSLMTTDMRRSSHGLRGIQWGKNSEQYLQINRMSDVFSERVELRSATEIVIPHTMAVNSHHPLIIADCQHGEVHQILSIEKNAAGQKITLATPISYSYKQPVFLGEWIEERWMIKPDAHGVNTLHFRSFQAEELSPLIHSLSVSDEAISGSQFLKIHLGLDDGKDHELMVRVRAS